MAEKKFSMPQSTAGLIRYYESSKEALHIKPEYVVGFSAFLIVLEIVAAVFF